MGQRYGKMCYGIVPLVVALLDGQGRVPVDALVVLADAFGRLESSIRLITNR